ncbi:MAG: ribbon-helix-helix domain-containing protein [Gallionella sp.]
MSVTTISATIPSELKEQLDEISRKEERSKSFYVRKGLEFFLKSRKEDLEDYEEAREAHLEFIASGETAVSIDKVFKDVK